MEFSEVFRSLININANLILVEFSGFSKLVKFSIFLRCGVDTSGNPRLINFSGFFRFQFKAKIVYYRASSYTVRGSK